MGRLKDAWTVTWVGLFALVALGGPFAAAILALAPDLGEPWEPLLTGWAVAFAVLFFVLVVGSMRDLHDSRQRFRRSLGLRSQRHGWFGRTFVTTYRGRPLRVRWAWRGVRLELGRAAPSKVPSLRIDGPDREWQDRPIVEARPPEAAAVLHAERLRQLRSRRLPRPFTIELAPEAVVATAPRDTRDRPMTRLLLQLDELERETRSKRPRPD